MAADPRDVCGGSAGAAGGRRELSGAGPPSGETHMAVAKKAKKDGVEVKIETSNDAQKDKKHSKRKIKTATLETSGLTLSIESVEPEKTSKKAAKAKKVKGEKTPKTAELQAVPEESPAAAAEPVKPTRLRKSAKKVVAKADADDLNTPESPAGDEKAKPVRKTRAAKKRSLRKRPCLRRKRLQLLRGKRQSEHARSKR